MPALTAICVDDEAHAHELLCGLLQQLEIRVLGRFLQPEAALSVVQQLRPDLLFLDVNMPGVDAFTFLRRLTWTPITALVTAHQDYALQAFDLGVREYLVKPVNLARLRLCVERLQPLVAYRHAEPRTTPDALLAVRCGHEKQLLDPSKISHIEAEGNFSILRGQQKEFFASETLKQLQERLGAFEFIRVHKSYLVNPRFISRITSQNVVLESGRVIAIGRAFRQAMLEHMARLGWSEFPER